MKVQKNGKIMCCKAIIKEMLYHNLDEFLDAYKDDLI